MISFEVLATHALSVLAYTSVLALWIAFLENEVVLSLHNHIRALDHSSKFSFKLHLDKRSSFSDYILREVIDNSFIANFPSTGKFMVLCAQG